MSVSSRLSFWWWGRGTQACLLARCCASGWRSACQVALTITPVASWTPPASAGKPQRGSQEAATGVVSTWRNAPPLPKTTTVMLRLSVSSSHTRFVSRKWGGGGGRKQQTQTGFITGTNKNCMFCWVYWVLLSIYWLVEGSCSSKPHSCAGCLQPGHCLTFTKCVWGAAGGNELRLHSCSPGSGCAGFDHQVMTSKSKLLRRPELFSA